MLIVDELVTMSGKHNAAAIEQQVFLNDAGLCSHAGLP
jgi:hypothetical protein